LEPLQLGAVQIGEMGIGKSTENEIAFLGAAVPGSEQQTPPVDIRTIVRQLFQEAVGIAHRKPCPS
jgi:hypothetical protein